MPGTRQSKPRPSRRWALQSPRFILGALLGIFGVVVGAAGVAEGHGHQTVGIVLIVAGAWTLVRCVRRVL